jgi:hypothetical protein
VGEGTGRVGLRAEESAGEEVEVGNEAMNAAVSLLPLAVASGEGCRVNGDVEGPNAGDEAGDPAGVFRSAVDRVTSVADGLNVIPLVTPVFVPDVTGPSEDDGAGEADKVESPFFFQHCEQ